MTLYAELLGESLARLPAPLRRIHGRRGTASYRGEVEVHAGAGVFARLFIKAAHLPPRYEGAINVEIVAAEKAEQWTRRFGTHVMHSRLWANAGHLSERLGPVRFDFVLEAVGAAVHWRVAQVRVCGFPLPAVWFSGVRAIESAQDGLYRFDVRATLPGVGLLVHYRGWLDVF